MKYIYSTKVCAILLKGHPKLKSKDPKGSFFTSSLRHKLSSHRFLLDLFFLQLYEGTNDNVGTLF